MTAVARLVLFAGAVYLGVQIARVEPGLAFPIGVLVTVFVAYWLFLAKYEAAEEQRLAAEEQALRTGFGDDLAELAVEEHHDRWEAQR